VTPAESLREKLIYFVENNFLAGRTREESCDIATRVVDEYVHELAEEIRVEGNRRDVVNNELEAMGFLAAADFIDPEVKP